MTRFTAGRVRALAVAALAASGCLVTAAPAAALEVVSSNTSPMTLPGGAPASVYPSEITVTGSDGPIIDVDVTVTGLSHTFPDDVDIVLQSPAGTATFLMSLTCGNADVNNVTLTFDDEAPAPLSSTGPCATGTVRPNAGGSVTLPAPAPAVSGASLGVFDGQTAEGTWKLYARDRVAEDAGSISGGWSIRVTTRDGGVVITGSGTASAYPWNRTTSGLPGVVRDVNVTLDGVYLDRPRDLQVLLVAPSGEAVPVMADVCGTSRLAGVTWRIDDDLFTPFPQAGPCGTGDFRSFAGGSPVFAAPAPQPPYASGLTGLSRADPNGVWKLYVQDSQDGNHVGIGDFALSVQTEPGRHTGFAAGFVEAAEGAAATVTVARAGLPAGTATVAYTTVAGSAAAGADFTPVSGTLTFAAGELTKTITVPVVDDSAEEDAEAFAVRLTSSTGDATLGAASEAQVRVPASDEPADEPAADPAPPAAPPAPPAKTPNPCVKLRPSKRAACRKALLVAERKAACRVHTKPALRAACLKAAAKAAAKVAGRPR